MSPRPKLRVNALADLEQILASDTEIYPTSTPTTLETIRKWYKFHPEFAMVYENNGIILGSCCVVALTRNGWDKLVKGAVSEAQITEDLLFRNGQDSELGLHIYHMDRDSVLWPQEVGRFGLIILEDLGQIIQSFDASISVIGFSGLAVSQSGIRLFRNLYGCDENKFICTEHVFKSTGGKLLVVDCATDQDVKEFLALSKGEYSLVTRCKMLSVTPSTNADSIVWRYLNPKADTISI